MPYSFLTDENLSRDQQLLFQARYNVITNTFQGINQALLATLQGEIRAGRAPLTYKFSDVDAIDDYLQYLTDHPNFSQSYTDFDSLYSAVTTAMSNEVNNDVNGLADGEFSEDDEELEQAGIMRRVNRGPGKGG